MALVRDGLAIEPFKNYGGTVAYIRTGDFGSGGKYLNREELDAAITELTAIRDALPNVPTPREKWRKSLEDAPLGSIIRDTYGPAWREPYVWVKVNDDLWHAVASGSHYKTEQFDLNEDTHKGYKLEVK